MTVAVRQPGIAGVPLARIADWLAAALAISLPWSTSATGILAVCWALAVVPTLDRSSVRNGLTIAAVALPVALFAYALVATLWSDATWPVRLRGVAPFAKLLFIPLLLYHFQRSDASKWVFGGFLASVCCLLAASYLSVLLLDVPRTAPIYGVPVKDYISQSGLFALTAVVLVDRAIVMWNSSRQLAVAAGGLALLLLANIFVIATGRTTLVSLAALVVVLGFRHFRKTQLILFLGGLVAVAVVVWVSSPYLQKRVISVAQELRDYHPQEQDTSAGSRIEFWKASVQIVRQAPLFGHGTGSTREVMSRYFSVDPAAANAPSNPHNQVLAVAIPLGLVGVALLLAMWIAHLRLFLQSGHVAWIGMAVVIQNFTGSLFNSHLFDFTQGWLYVLGVGVAGGVLMRENSLRNAGSASATRP